MYMNIFSVLKMSVTRARHYLEPLRRFHTLLAMSSGPTLCLIFSLSNIYEQDPRARRMLGIVVMTIDMMIIVELLMFMMRIMRMTKMEFQFLLFILITMIIIRHGSRVGGSQKSFR